MVPNINLHFPSCVCLCICGPRIFEFTPQDAARLSDIFYGLSPPVIMSNLNKWVFHSGGSTPTCSAQHTYSHFQTVRLILDVVPFFRAHHKTPNTAVCLLPYRLKTPQIHIVTRALHFSCSHVTLDKFA